MRNQSAIGQINRGRDLFWIEEGQKHFRPISLTSHIIKIFERILRDKLVSYLEDNSIITPNQHGFRKNCSCLSQLLSHTNFLMEALRSGADVDTVYLDYSKAFDKVDHTILLRKLQIYKITGKYYNWIKNLLTDRKQTVSVNGVFSYETPVISGVPQGSVLGPLLFLIYINDLVHSIKFSKIQTFADDTKVSLPIQTKQDQKNLQRDLNQINKWSTINNMVLNEDKYVLVCYKSQGNKAKKLFNELPFAENETTYMAGKTIIYPSSTVRDLGITVNSDLNWKDHVTKL